MVSSAPYSRSTVMASGFFIIPSGHVHGAPFHSQTQDKIECQHLTTKNRVLLENYYTLGDLRPQITSFVEYYNNQRHHESMNNVTPADVYFGGDKGFLEKGGKSINRPADNPACIKKISRIINYTNEPEPPMLRPLYCQTFYDGGQ